MAMKLPVVASGSRATREVVTDLRDGFLFPVGDVDRLTDAVELALGAPELRATLAARALRKIQGPLSAGASATVLAGVLESVLERSRRARTAAATATALAPALAAAGG